MGRVTNVIRILSSRQILIKRRLFFRETVPLNRWPSHTKHLFLQMAEKGHQPYHQTVNHLGALKVHSKFMISSQIGRSCVTLPRLADKLQQPYVEITRALHCTSERTLYIPKLFTWSFPHQVGISVESSAISGETTTITLATLKVNKCHPTHAQ